MNVVNLFAGPSAGKSTCAANLFCYLKSHHVSTELVGEFAKELIYAGNEVQLVNQVYIMGAQYKKLKDLERNNVDIAISDSPLLLQIVYCKDRHYFEEMFSLVKKLDNEFNNINVFINRKNPYQKLGRYHSEEESLVLDKKIWDLMNGAFHYVIDGTNTGYTRLGKEVLKKADKELLSKF